MIPHATCRKTHGNSSRTSGALILTLKRKQTKQCSYFCNRFFFFFSILSLTFMERVRGNEAGEMDNNLSANRFIILRHHLNAKIVLPT